MLPAQEGFTAWYSKALLLLQDGKNFPAFLLPDFQAAPQSQIAANRFNLEKQ